MTPQHLQQSDQYHEALLHARMRAVATYDWGITGLQFDERALVAGQLKVVKCHGFFPDGTPFFVGDRGEDNVEARPLEGAFPASMEFLDVFLAIPNLRETAFNVGLDPAKAGPAVRFLAQSVTVPDLNTGRNETALSWARENLRLLFGTEPRDAFQTIRIGQLVRDRTGAVVVRKSIIPPVLHVYASDHLMAGLRRVLSALVGKQKSLAEGRRMRTAAAVDFQASDTAKFWLLHTVNSYIPIVSHLVDHGMGPPEDCYRVIGGLIGELCTFSADGDPTAIPKFNYLELGDVFDPMFERAIAMITGVIAENYIVVPLEKREDGMYLGKFETRSFAHARTLPRGQGDRRRHAPRAPAKASEDRLVDTDRLHPECCHAWRACRHRVSATWRHPSETRVGLPSGRPGWRLLERYPRLWHYCDLSAY